MKQKVIKSYNRLTGIFTRELFEATLLPAILMVAAVVIGYKFIDPAPPRQLVIATNVPGSNYNAFAHLYREYLKKEGISLNIQSSRGDVDNLQLLKDEHSGVDMAFIQDGVASTEGAGTLVSLGSLYYDPVWIFCRCNDETEHLAELKGKRIAVGKVGSGNHVLSLALLKASGVTGENSTLVDIGEDESVAAMLRHDVDVAILTESPTSPRIQQILSDASIHLMNLGDAEAYTRQFHYLHHLVLPEGGLDLAHNIPSRDIHLVSPVVTLVARGDVHPALIYLMLKTIAQIHDGSSILNKEKEFPSDKDNDFPLSDQASSFYKSGLPFLDRYLPFWLATFVNRSLIVIVPLLALLIPLTKLIPTLYTWLIKMKLYRYYGELRFLETQLRQSDQPRDREEYLAMLNDIEDKVNELKLPISFAQHVYELRGYIELVRTNLLRRES
jgi:TRAP transporter TAXI family solute receptor